jgi:hypothetical protein
MLRKRQQKFVEALNINSETLLLYRSPGNYDFFIDVYDVYLNFKGQGPLKCKINPKRPKPKP